jgi:transposase
LGRWRAAPRAVSSGSHRAGWEAEILAWHRTAGCSNGPTEAINLLIKKVKRVGHGFRNFANYRLRLLLHCGVRWQTHHTARLRSRSPRLVA